MLRPPIGVALLGFLVLMAGFAFTVMGFRYSGFVVFGPGDIGSGLLLWGLLTLLAGIMFIVAAFALWSTQPWGWLFTHFLAILGLLDAFFVWIANNSFTDGLAVAIFPLVVLWYLNQRDIKAAFGSGERQLGHSPGRCSRHSWARCRARHCPRAPRPRRSSRRSSAPRRRPVSTRSPTAALLAGEDPVEAWRATAALTDRAVKAVLLGPYSARRQRCDGRRPQPRHPRPGRCRLPARRGPRAGRDPDRDGPDERARFRDLHQRLLDGVTGTHLSLAITGGDAKAAGVDTLLAAPYASLAVDLIAGPDNWNLVVRTPGDRGVICGVLPAEGPTTAGDHRLGGGLRDVDRRPRPGPGRDRDGLVAGAPPVGRRGGQDGAARGCPPDRHRIARRASRGARSRAVDSRSAALGRYEPGPSQPPRRGHDPT